LPLYRLARAADAPELAKLRWGLRTDDALTFDEGEKARFIQNFVAWMNRSSDKDLVHWVAERDGGLIAVMSVRVVHKLPSPEEFEGKIGYLANSYVRPEYRNRGVGTALLAAVKQWALSEKLELLVVWPSELAHSFYERAGYRRYDDPVVLKLRDG